MFFQHLFLELIQQLIDGLHLDALSHLSKHILLELIPFLILLLFGFAQTVFNKLYCLLLSLLLHLHDFKSLFTLILIFVFELIIVLLFFFIYQLFFMILAAIILNLFHLFLRDVVVL